MQFLLPYVLPFLSKFGFAVAAFLAGWFVASIYCDANYKAEAKILQDRIEMSFKVETERERAAAAEIAQDATIRAVEDQSAIDELNSKIAAFQEQEASRGKKTPNCDADRDFINSLRDLGKGSNRRSK